MNMMIIIKNSISYFYRCPSRKHSLNPGDSISSKEFVIPNYYSDEEAKKAGWKCTTDIMFCEPGRSFVWMCPECASEVEWENTPQVEFSSRKTKEERRKGERRKTPCYMGSDIERRSLKQRDQDRRGKKERKERKEFERHLKAQR